MPLITFPHQKKVGNNLIKSGNRIDAVVKLFDQIANCKDGIMQNK